MQLNRETTYCNTTVTKRLETDIKVTDSKVYPKLFFIGMHETEFDKESLAILKEDRCIRALDRYEAIQLMAHLEQFIHETADDNDEEVA